MMRKERTDRAHNVSSAMRSRRAMNPIITQRQGAASVALPEIKRLWIRATGHSRVACHRHALGHIAHSVRGDVYAVRGWRHAHERENPLLVNVKTPQFSGDLCALALGPARR